MNRIVRLKPRTKGSKQEWKANMNKMLARGYFDNKSITFICMNSSINTFVNDREGVKEYLDSI